MALPRFSAAAVLASALLLAGCGPMPINPTDSSVHELSRRLDASNPAKQQQRFGVLLSLIGKTYERPNFTANGEGSMVEIDWHVPGVSVRFDIYWRGQKVARELYEFNEQTNSLQRFRNSVPVGPAYPGADGRIYSIVDRKTMTLSVPTPTTFVMEDGAEKRVYDLVAPEAISERLAAQAAVGRQQRAAEERAASKKSSEFWSNMATGLAVVAQATNEVLAEQAVANASTQAFQANLAASAAAKTAADNAARSRAEQQRAEQLAALNRTMAANRQAAANLPAQQRQATAANVAASQQASQQIAQAQRAAETRAQAAQAQARQAAEASRLAQAQAQQAQRNAVQASANVAALRQARGGDSASMVQAMSTGAAGMPKEGQYQLEGGTYTITVKASGGDIMVQEPNKNSHYRRQPDGSFHSRNPNNGILYGLRAAGDGVLEAFKPENAAAGVTRLVLVGDANAKVEVDDSWFELAEQYRAKSQTDKANVQAWTACAAVAMKRAVSTKQAADNYAQQMAQMLRQMDAHTSPCPEVIQY